MSLIGSVKFFDTKKGWGFITLLTQDLPLSNTEVFVHFSNVNVRDHNYKRLYPGEYVSFSLGKNSKGQDTCIDVCGVMGGALLTDHPEHIYKIYPKVSHRSPVSDDPEDADKDADNASMDANDSEGTE